MDGYVGDFCEFKTEQDHLLFISGNIGDDIQLVFNANGKLIGEGAVVDGGATVYGSCSTIFNGEAIIFGGWIFNRQVR